MLSKIASTQFSDEDGCFEFRILEHSKLTWNSNHVLAATVLCSVFIVSPPLPMPPIGRMVAADNKESISLSVMSPIYKYNKI